MTNTTPEREAITYTDDNGGCIVLNINRKYRTIYAAMGHDAKETEIFDAQVEAVASVIGAMWKAGDEVDTIGVTANMLLTQFGYKIAEIEQYENGEF